MTNILIESYKKVFENKKANIGLIIFAFLWTSLSIFVDIRLGNIYSLKQNPVDLICNILIGIYSLQFLHNAIENINGGVLPKITEITPKTIIGLLGLNIVWGLYACFFIVLAVVLYIKTHFMIVPIVIVAFLLFLAPFIYYFFLAYAENFKLKGLFNVFLICKLIKPAAKNLYINLTLFIIISLLTAAAYILIYTVAGITGIDRVGIIIKDVYVLDLFMNTFAGYFVIITWYFAFPYSLISSYNKYVRPVLRKDFIWQKWLKH